MKTVRKHWNRYMLDTEIGVELAKQGARKSTRDLNSERRKQALDAYITALVASRGEA